MSLALKKQIIQTCLEELDQKIKVLDSEYALYRESAAGETKSTAGDKHDTAKSMMQYEQEKMGAQLSELRKLRQILLSIKPDQNSAVVAQGSLVRCEQQNFFIGISSRPVIVDKQTYLPLSLQAPLGRLMLGKTAGAFFEFNQKQYRILSVE